MRIQSRKTSRMTFQYISEIERDYNDGLFEPNDLEYYNMECISSRSKPFNAMMWLSGNRHYNGNGSISMRDISTNNLTYFARNILNPSYLSKSFYKIQWQATIDIDRW